MSIVLFVLKLVFRIILVPVWLVLALAEHFVGILVCFYNMAKSLVGIVMGIAFIGNLIWYRQDLWRFAMIAITEGILFLILMAGIFVQVVLEEARDGIGNIIFGG